MAEENNREEPVYVISVAARLADVHPQTLRIYERKGLIDPARVHNRRRFSEADIDRCKLIQELTREMGVNLAGVKMILEMRERMERMKKRMRNLEHEVDELKQDMEEQVKRVRESLRHDIVHVPRGELARLEEINSLRNILSAGKRKKREV